VFDRFAADHGIELLLELIQSLNIGDLPVNADNSTLDGESLGLMNGRWREIRRDNRPCPRGMACQPARESSSAARDLENSAPRDVSVG
jgi:hypothetical protein